MIRWKRVAKYFFTLIGVHRESFARTSAALDAAGVPALQRRADGLLVWRGHDERVRILASRVASDGRVHVPARRCLSSEVRCAP